MSAARTVVHKDTNLIVQTSSNDGHEPSICIRKGRFFMYVPIDQAYALVNAIHDHADQIERDQQKAGPT